MFTESLTVRILGDSSGLQAELESVARTLDGLQAEFEGVTSSGRNIGEGLSRAALALTPLNQVSGLLNIISAEAARLSAQPITLNVAPAVAALTRLSAMVQSLAAQLQLIGGGLAGVGGGVLEARVSAQAAAGGRVERQVESSFGMRALSADRGAASAAVPEMLLGLELTRPAARELQPAWAARSAPTGRRDATMISSTQQTTNNNFGGITIQMAEGASVADVVRDLQLRGAAMRNRRG